jgi:hypothetical protein
VKGCGGDVPYVIVSAGPCFRQARPGEVHAGRRERGALASGKIPSRSLREPCRSRGCVRNALRPESLIPMLRTKVRDAFDCELDNNTGRTRSALEPRSTTLTWASGIGRPTFCWQGLRSC